MTMTKTRPRPFEQRSPLSCDRVLRAALRLADKAGIEAVSMRRLAGALGVEAMSLYKHVDGKDALLDGLLDLVITEIEVPPPGTGWREAMRARALSARRVFLHHRWAATFFESRIHQPSPVRLGYADAVLGLLREDGFSPVSAYRAFLLIDSYIYGFIQQETHWPLDNSERPEAAAEMTAQIPDEGYPHLREVMTAAMAGTPICSTGALEGEFERGLDLILDAVARLRE